jgi:AraC-like DNA-binding protein
VQYSASARVPEHRMEIQRLSIGGIDSLRGAVANADFELVQLERGRLVGALTHIKCDGMGLSFGRFSHGIRARGVVSSECVAFGMLLGSARETSQWDCPMAPGDVVVYPRNQDHEAVYRGGAAYATVYLSPDDVDPQFKQEAAALGEPSVVDRARVYSAPSSTRREICQRAAAIVSGIEAASTTAPAAIDFLSRSLLETYLTSILGSLPPEQERQTHNAFALVRDTEDYVSSAGERAVHISEICTALDVSRRTLHRAFSDRLGVGPIEYLKRKRLSVIHTILARSDPAVTNVSDVAMENGFFELGRFAHYYRKLFGENPSETLKKPHEIMPAEAGKAKI